MEQHEGIIQVVDQSDEQEDEVLVALRALPKFEPLVVPDAPSHFSLANVFSSFSTSVDTRGASTELAFNPSVLVDILVQINAHSKRCGQDIQEFQRSLGTKMKVLDDFTSGAVQELTAIHKQAKAHSDQLLSVQALAKQAQTTTTLLHGIINKLNLLSDALPTDVGTLGITESKYPYLYQYIHQTPEHYGHMGTKGTKTGTSSENWSSPIGLTLLGQKTSLLNKRPIATITSTSTTGISASATNRGYPHQHHNHMSSRTSGIAIPKARASMALASDPLNFLPLQSTSLSDLDSTFGGLSMDGNGLLSVSPVPRPLSADIIHEASSTRNGHGTALLPQQRTQTASDNLRRLANKPAPEP